MSALENLTFMEIIKEMATFLTHIGVFSLKVFCYSHGVQRYKNH